MKELVLMLLLFTARLGGQNTTMPSAATMGTGVDLARQCTDATPVRKVEDGVAGGYEQGYCFGVLTTAAEILDADG